MNVGVGVEPIIADHHLPLVGDMGCHSRNELQIIHRLLLRVDPPVPVFLPWRHFSYAQIAIEPHFVPNTLLSPKTAFPSYLFADNPNTLPPYRPRLRFLQTPPFQTVQLTRMAYLWLIQDLNPSLYLPLA